MRNPGQDPKRARVYVVVSRQALLDSRFSTVICAPIHSEAEGLTSQVPVGVQEGLKHDSWILCDHLVSLPKQRLTDYIGSLSTLSLIALSRALKIALGLD